MSLQLMMPVDRTRALAAAVGEGEGTVKAMLFGAASLVTLSSLALAATPALQDWAGELHAGSARVALGFVGLMLWLGLVGIFGAAWCTGAFDALLRAHRNAQAVALFGAVSLLAWASTSMADGAIAAGDDAGVLHAAGAFVLPALALMAALQIWRRPQAPPTR